jgi:integrase
MEKVKQLIGQLYKWAIREDIVSKSYAQFIIIPESESKEKTIFTDAQIAALEADGTDDARVVLMLIYTGVRINELFSATLDNYHGTYYITGSKTEAGRNRVVPIPKAARHHFEHFAASATTKLLDGYAGNKNVNNFREREFAALMKRLGIEGVTPHCTRHTYASHAASAGMRAEVLQKILGHASYSTTAEIYVHSDTDEIVAAAENVW